MKPEVGCLEDKISFETDHFTSLHPVFCFFSLPIRSDSFADSSRDWQPGAMPQSIGFPKFKAGIWEFS